MRNINEKIENKATVLICECTSREHQIIIEHDNEDNLTYCHIHLVKRFSAWRCWGLRSTIAQIITNV
jgi:hypothetical protein